MTLQVAILVFDDVEALDFAGPYEVFTTASRVHGRGKPGAAPLFAVRCVARDATPVRARAGMRVLPDATFAEASDADLLVVPGGVVDGPLADPATLAWIAASAARAATVASVCTGAFLLAKSGVVREGQVTTHWEDLDDLRAAFPALEVVGDRRWVELPGAAPRRFSSAGISAGIDLCLHLVAELAGRELAERTARQMDYGWRQTP